MVAWRMTLTTPQYPDGRDIYVIANDITHEIGSFGPKEDLLFKVSASHVTVLSLDHVTLHLMSFNPVSAVCIDRRCPSWPVSRMPRGCTLQPTVEPGLDWHKS